MINPFLKVGQQLFAWQERFMAPSLLTKPQGSVPLNMACLSGSWWLSSYSSYSCVAGGAEQLGSECVDGCKANG